MKINKCNEIFFSLFLEVFIPTNFLFQISRFVGKCIDRGGTGLRAWFVLRNVIDGQVSTFSFTHFYLKPLLLV